MSPGDPAMLPATHALDRLRVRSMIGFAEDGASYLAESDTGPVELWRLGAGALTPAVQRRLALLARITSTHQLAVREVLGSFEPHHVIVGDGAIAWSAASLWAAGADALRVELSGLFGALAEAHHLGVVHGRLGREHLGRRADGGLVLDLTGLRVRRGEGGAPAAPGGFAAAPSRADDVWALAWLAKSAAEGAGLDLGGLLAEDPERRPTAREASALFADVATQQVPRAGGSSTPASDPGPAAEDPTLHGVPRRLGAYHLIESIGAGGMGRVFRARDEGDGSLVAVKVLLPHLALQKDLVARFRREARVLARLQSPFVARYLGANEQDGFHYLAMELVTGEGADDVLRARKKLDVDAAVRITCDVARALAEVHALGLVHRDIKPANVLVTHDANGAPAARLCDFGIARPEAPRGEADDLTREGAPGTPSFMSPEQVEGAPVDARTDVYALGATLFTLLAGRAPFVGPSHFVMISHVTEPAPYLSDIEPTVPRPIADVVARCLAKIPQDRPASGAALLDALSDAWRGPSTGGDALPHRIGVEGEPRAYDFVWALEATPDELWPHVSNTDRLNRAAGLDEVEWSHDASGGDVQTRGTLRALGMELRWKENPFEWVAPHRLGVLREYQSGPFLWLRNTVTMEPRPAGGTTLRHRIEIRPRTWLGQAVASVEVGLRLRRGLGRAYEHIDAACIGSRSSARPVRGGSRSAPQPDPFEAREPADSALQGRIDARTLAALRRGADPHVMHVLAEEAGSAPAPSLTRMRPRAWARARGFGEETTLSTFLLAASEKLLELQWDLLCPVCRIASSIEASLEELRSHGHCDACDLDFELDLAKSVELVFRVHPTLRDVQIGTYCIGGPAHSPHVLAQVRLRDGERFPLDLELQAGRYRVTGRGLPVPWPFMVDASESQGTWDLPLRAGASPSQPRRVAAGRQRLSLTNDLGREVLVRVEREAERDDAVTAADAATNELFRELFPEQVLAPNQLVAVSRVTMLFAQVADALERYDVDEGRVHAELLELADAVRRAVAEEGGALVRIQGNGVLAVFSDPTVAVRVVRLLRRSAPDAAIALHGGPAQMTTIGGRLDYFGRTAHVVETMGRRARRAEILVGETIAHDEQLASWIHEGTRSLGYVNIGVGLAERLAVDRAQRSAGA